MPQHPRSSTEAASLSESRLVAPAKPQAAFFNSPFVHLVRHSLNFCSWQDRKAVAARLREVYGAETAEAAWQALGAFDAEWGRQYLSIAQAWRRAWQEVIPFFAFSPVIRRVITTTNAVESLNRVIGKAIKTRGSFPSEEAAEKLIYLAILSHE